MTREELYAQLVKLKKPLMEEFQARGIEAHERGEEDLTYTDFCVKKLTEAELSLDQLIVANSLIDLAIGIGRMQVLAELVTERKNTCNYIIRVHQPVISC
jgi:hypothetical protein